MTPAGQRSFRVLLHLYPRQFRNQFGTEILQVISDRYTYDTRSRNGFAALMFWVLVSLDLLTSAVQQRIEASMAAHVWTRTSGLLGMIGGVLWGIWVIIQSVTVGQDVVGLLGPAMLALSVAATAFLITETRASPTYARVGVGFALTQALVLFVNLVLFGFDGVWYLWVAVLFLMTWQSAAVGFAMRSSRAYPIALSIGMWVSAGLFVFSNTENLQILLMLPFGAAWIAAGYTIWSATTQRLTLSH